VTLTVVETLGDPAVDARRGGADMKVLVGHATAHGSTREIAEHLARRLREDGLDTEVQELTAAAGLEHFDAFVLGSAIHHRRWLPEARAFLFAHAHELAARPVWLFSVGMPAALRGPLRPLAGLQPAAVAADFDHLVAFRDHALFSGVVRSDHLPLIGRIAMLALTRGPGDYRDWHAIDAWGDGVARVLTTLGPPAGPTTLVARPTTERR
jgi:menaquinone-dependent protoporphyrinogen oxidase